MTKEIDYKKLYEEARKKNEIMELFNTMVRHEIPDCLNAINGLGSLLQEGEVEEATVPIFGKHITQQAQKIEKVSKLMQLFGNINKDRKKFNLEETLIAGSNSAKERISEHNRNTQIHYNEPTIIYANESVVETLQSSLLGNAISRASPNSTINQSIDSINGDLILRMENYHHDKKIVTHGLNGGYGLRFLEHIIGALNGDFKIYEDTSKITKDYNFIKTIGNKAPPKYTSSSDEKFYGVELIIPKAKIPKI